MHQSRTVALTVALVAILAALAWWLLGGFPWAVSGFHLGPAATGEDAGSGLDAIRMPLPLTVSALPSLVALSTIGGVCAGLLPIAVTHIPRPLAILEVCVVVLVTTAVTTAISAHRVKSASPGFGADDRVLVGLTLVVFAGTVVGLVLATVAITWHGATSVAAAVVAGLMPTWVHDLFAHGAGAGQAFARHAGDVAVAVVLGAGLIVSVRRTRAAMLGWPVALAALWLTGPVITATAYLTALLRPGSGLPDALPEHLAAARQVFGEAIRHTHPAYVPVVIALIAGAAAAAYFTRTDDGGPTAGAPVRSG